MTDSGGAVQPGVPRRRSYTVLLRDRTALDDLIGLGIADHALNALSIRGDGLNLRVDQPVTVSVADDRITIKAVVPAATEAVADAEP